MKKEKIRKIAPFLLICLLLFVTIGGTYAILSIGETGGQNTITTGTIAMSYTESTNVISIINALPMTDADGMLLDDYFDFSVTSTVTSNIEASVPYEISIEPLSVDNGYTALTDSQIKVYLTSVTSNNESVLINSTFVNNLPSSSYDEDSKALYNKTNSHDIGETTITSDYRIRAWIDYSVDSSTWTLLNKYEYKFKVNVNSTNTITGKLLANDILNKNISYYDNVASPYVTNNTGIDFSTTSSPTNGQGLYKTSTGTENDKLTYYFRGGSYCSNASLNTSALCTAVSGAKWSTNHCTLPATTKATCEATTGNVWYELNNWVYFAGYYWQVLRVNEDGSVRMIYAGTSPTTKGSDDVAGSSEYTNERTFNGTLYRYFYEDKASAGYMLISLANYSFNYYNQYSPAHSITFGPNANQIESMLKVRVESWYERHIKGITTGTCSNGTSTTRIDCLQADALNTWLPGAVSDTDYSSYVADPGYCNDLSINASNQFNVVSGTNVYTGLLRTSSPQFLCNHYYHLYTVSETNGNGDAAYPIGLITRDEVIYAGGQGGVNNYSYLLYMNNTLWTLSPANMGINARATKISGGQLTSDYVAMVVGYSPVISINSDTMILSGDGSIADPYVIS